MKWVWLAALVLLIVVMMRAISWALGWALTRVAPHRTKLAVGAGNAAGFGLFAGYLALNLSPGEPMDYEPVAFGLIVFGTCWLMDLRWRPWKEKGGRFAQEGAETGARAGGSQ